MRLIRLSIGVLFVFALVSGCGGGSDDSSSARITDGASAGVEVAKTKPKIVPPKGPAPKELVIEDLKEGVGPAAKAGDEITVQYVGVEYRNGKQFDSSWDRDEPFTFALGSGQLIKGWEEGLEGMKVGGRRQLITPPAYAYGSEGVGSIPPNATLVFVVDLLAIQ